MRFIYLFSWLFSCWCFWNNNYFLCFLMGTCSSNSSCFQNKTQYPSFIITANSNSLLFQGEFSLVSLLSMMSVFDISRLNSSQLCYFLVLLYSMQMRSSCGLISSTKLFLKMLHRFLSTRTWFLICTWFSSIIWSVNIGLISFICWWQGDWCYKISP